MNIEDQIKLRLAASIEKRLNILRNTNKATHDNAPVVPGTDPVAQSPSISTPLQRDPPARGTVVQEIGLADGNIRPVLNRAEELAALSGRFTPDTLFSGDILPGIKRKVLSLLAPRCIIENGEQGVQWLLAQEQRRTVLAGLLKQGNLSEKLAQPLPRTDRFGSMLRKLLAHGAGLPIHTYSQPDMLALASAMEATAGMDIAHPDAVEVRRLSRKERFLSDYRVLLEKGFLGRQKELRRLNEFLKAKDSAPNYKWHGLTLTGIGGAGKSTLLAKFAINVLSAQSATIVILDFDRPGFNPTDTYWLEAEMSRQVGQQYPLLEDRLHLNRREARRQQENEGQSLPSFSAETVTYQRTLRRTVGDITAALRDVQADNRPFLLVLDTIEEVEQRDLTEPLLEWLNQLSSILMPTPLKVIFSGRLFESSLERLEQKGIETIIRVDEFEPKLAEQLLIKLNVPRAQAQRLARSKILPLRPLELKLLAKIVMEEPANSIDELEAEVRQGGDCAKDLFAGIVYRRVLLRIGNDTTRLLAYPGLVLRYVTPELIRYVLVPALQNDPSTDEKARQILHALDSDEEATKALEQLSSYGWLANKEPNGEVWHRKDLRRSMLKAMIAQEPEKAKLIHQEAIRFFADKPSEREFAEGMYHQLMLVRTPKDGENLELAVLKKVSQYLQPDLPDLPRPAATVLRFAIDSRIPMADVELLPDPYLAKAYFTTGKRLLNNREFGKAYRLLQRGIETGIAFAYRSNNNLQSQWEHETLFATGTWDKLIEVLYPLRVLAPPLTFISVAQGLYPTIVVAPELLKPTDVEAVLIELAENNGGFESKSKNPEKTLYGSAFQIIINRLCMAILLGNKSRPFSPHAIQPINNFLLSIMGGEDAFLTANLKRKLLLVSFISAGETFELGLSPSSIKLDPAWLLKLATSEFHLQLDPDLTRLLLQARDILLRPSGGRQQRSARGILGAIDALYKEGNRWRHVKVSLTGATAAAELALTLTRGPDPEFRDPIRFALLEAYPDRASRRLLGEKVSSVLPFGLDDLSPDAFADILAADPEHGLETYIELVDRNWSLGELLRQVRRERTSTKLEQVSRAYERWDEAVRTTVRDALK